VLTHTSSNMTWDFIKRLRDITRMKIIIKGILAHEDVTLCVQNGVDGLIVSNHGGRGEDSGRSTIDALPEIVEAVGGRIPVLVDGGIRRGTDVVKAHYRRTGRLHRPALFMGVGRVRPAGCGTRAGNHARRNARCHAAMHGERAKPGVRAPGHLNGITGLDRNAGY
jgi:FMN-dependent dehydrogenase